MANATAAEQLMLEYLNEARLDPMANAQRFIYSYWPLISLQADVAGALKSFAVDGGTLYQQLLALQPVGALAWNDGLATAAEKHSAAMIAADEQSHQISGEAGLAARVTAEGYTGYRTLGENVFAYSSSLLYGHAGFMVDWGDGEGGIQSPAGHRDNIMSANFTEVGIDVTAEKNDSTSVGPNVITEDFGSRGKLFVTGVAYTDGDLNNFYSIGEGVAGLKATWGTATATSGEAGGYSLQVPTLGAGVITLTGGGLSGAVTVNASITDKNLKLDVVDGNTLLTSGSITVSGPVSTIRVIAITDTSVTAGAGNQKIVGNDGVDTLDGGAGDDSLFGGYDNDKLFGGDGNDQLKGENGNDRLDGGNGIDTAIYNDARAKYIVLAGRDGSVTVSGDRDGTDNVVNVENFRFSDGVYSWNAATGSLTLLMNHAPTLPATQNVATGVAKALEFTVAAADVDGDILTYGAGRPANGVVMSKGGGVFVYTPKAGFVGTDSFAVTVSDGRGGTASQTVNINVAKANEAPTIVANQSVQTNQGVAKLITVTGSDVDGDALTYNAAQPGHGSVTGGANGVFTYTPTRGYSGSDSFVVTVSDGKGGSATQTVNVQVAFVVAPPLGGGAAGAPFQFFLSNGQAGAIGGTGIVTGTNGLQDVTVLGNNDHISFDGSFNRGGDIIRLPGAASNYAVLISGAIVELRSTEGTYTIPLGEVGTSLVFDDGVRKLVYDAIGDLPKIGNQTITSTAMQIVAPTDHMPLPSGANPNASGRIFMSSGADISVGGNQSVLGTQGAEKIHYFGGDLVLDGSFNRGGDTLFLDNPISNFEAYLAGAQVILVSGGGEITIPVGEAGMKIDFDGDERVLRYDPATGSVLLGSLAITSVSPTDPDPLYDGGLQSLDLGSPGRSIAITLDADTDYILTEDGSINSNVLLTGFDFGDVIQVTGANASDYNFSNADGDRDGVYGDLVISFNDDGAKNNIVLLDVLSPAAFVNSLSSAQAALGAEFITFG